MASPELIPIVMFDGAAGLAGPTEPWVPEPADASGVRPRPVADIAARLEEGLARATVRPPAPAADEPA